MTEIADALAKLLAEQRVPPSTVYMDGSHNPRMSEIRAAEQFVEDHHLAEPSVSIALVKDLIWRLRGGHITLDEAERNLEELLQEGLRRS